MSWLFSQVLVEEYLGDISSDGEQSAPLSGSLTPQAYCAPDKMTDFSRLFLFGMTFRPLTEGRGEELLMSYLEAFPVRTSLPQEREQGLTESDQECGKKWHGSFTKYSPDSSLWKTHQCSLLGDLEPFLETWPRWGLMRNGECWEQQTLAHHTSETESGSEQKQMWLTPRVVEVDETPENFRRRMNSKRPNDRKNGFGSLTMQVKAMQKWPTPTAHNAKEGAFPAEYNRKTPALAAEVGGQLNPMWVEWLMGWPLGWTDLKPLGMDKFQKWQDEHGKS